MPTPHRREVVVDGASHRLPESAREGETEDRGGGGGLHTWRSRNRWRIVRCAEVRCRS